MWVWVWVWGVLAIVLNVLFYLNYPELPPPQMRMLRVVSRVSTNILWRNNNLYPDATYISHTQTTPPLQIRRKSAMAHRTEIHKITGPTEFSAPGRPGIMNFPQWSADATQTLAELIQDNHDKVRVENVFSKLPSTLPPPPPPREREREREFGFGGLNWKILTSITFTLMKINVMYVPPQIGLMGFSMGKKKKKKKSIKKKEIHSRVFCYRITLCIIYLRSMISAPALLY